MARTVPSVSATHASLTERSRLPRHLLWFLTRTQLWEERRSGKEWCQRMSLIRIETQTHFTSSSATQAARQNRQLRLKQNASKLPNFSYNSFLYHNRRFEVHCTILFSLYTNLALLVSFISTPFQSLFSACTRVNSPINRRKWSKIIFPTQLI